MTLALSLHAPDDELRDELVPINTRWKVDEALDAAHRYFETTGRRVSIEYALIKDMNDQAWRADLLGDKLNQRGPRLGARQPDPAQPDPRLEVDRLTTRASSSSSSSGCARTASRRRSATPGAARSTAPAASWPPPPPEPFAPDGATAGHRLSAPPTGPGQRLSSASASAGESTRCTAPAIPRPAPSATRVSHTGTTRVQCSPPTSTRGAGRPLS